ncbi:MAG: methyl-accepting chemotaxis protein [Desulfotalea sp.]
MKVSSKIILITGSLSFIIVTMFAITWWVTGTQKDDGAGINLAGRQRMLSQKMTKELLEGVGAGNEQMKQEAFSAAKNSMRVFDITLQELIRGGKIPLSVDRRNQDTYQSQAATGKTLQLLQEVQPLWREYSSKMDNVIANKPSSTTDLKWILQNSNKLLETMNRAVGQMQKDAESSVTLLLLLQFAGLMTAVILLVISIIVIRKIIMRLKKITHFAGVIGSGDLRAKSGVTGADEIGQIGISLDLMSNNLNTMFSEVSSNSISLNNLSTALGNIAVEMSERSGSTSDISIHVSGVANEMNSNMHNVAAAIEEASTNISVVASATEEMTSTISEIVRSTENAQSISGEAVAVAKSASDKVDELGKAASEIGNVTETITEISEQTNLLALNATIEAARAGEAGKGFAVVANEIKDLASQTANATQEIKQRIEGIQQSTIGTVNQIQQISKIIHEVNNIVMTITTSVEEQSSTTAEIAENIAQASIGIQEVTENVAQLSTVSDEVAADMNEVTTNSQSASSKSEDVQKTGIDIEQLATKFSDMVAKIKLQ